MIKGFLKNSDDSMYKNSQIKTNFVFKKRCLLFVSCFFVLCVLFIIKDFAFFGFIEEKVDRFVTYLASHVVRNDFMDFS